MADSPRKSMKIRPKKPKENMEHEAGDFVAQSSQEELEARIIAIQNRYSEGDMGKEEAYRDIEQILGEVESESQVIPIPVAPYGEQKPDEEYGSQEEELEDDLETTGLRDKITELQKLEQASTSKLLQVKKDALLMASAAAVGQKAATNVNEQSAGKRRELGLFSSPDKVPFTDEEKEREFTALLSSTETPETDFDEILEPKMIQESMDEKDAWRVDLEYLTVVLKSKGERCYDDALKLKYKEPRWPHQVHLHRILSSIPQLTVVVLNGSEISGLRDLGSNLQSLITLSVSKCNLRSLDGTSAFPNLRNLIASYNKIKHPAQCSMLTKLCHLDLSQNPITDFEGFAHLCLCPDFRSLRVYDTEFTKLPNFSKTLKKLIPQLREIYPESFDDQQDFSYSRLALTPGVKENSTNNVFNKSNNSTAKNRKDDNQRPSSSSPTSAHPTTELDALISTAGKSKPISSRKKRSTLSSSNGKIDAGKHSSSSGDTLEKTLTKSKLTSRYDNKMRTDGSAPVDMSNAKNRPMNGTTTSQAQASAAESKRVAQLVSKLRMEMIERRETRSDKGNAPEDKLTKKNKGRKSLKNSPASSPRKN